MVSNQKLDKTLKVLNKIKLKKEGVATLQSFFIFFFASIENLIRHGYGIVTGLVLFAVVILDRKSTRLNSSHVSESRMPSSA